MILSPMITPMSRSQSQGPELIQPSATISPSYHQGENDKSKARHQRLTIRDRNRFRYIIQDRTSPSFHHDLPSTLQAIDKYKCSSVLYL